MTIADRVAREIARDDSRREALGDVPAKPVPTGTFNTISGVTSSPLYGPRSTWARQIKSWYPSVDHVHVDSRRTVRATHPGSEAFTLGFVTVHKGACATCGDTDHDTATHTSPVDYIPIED